jgi:hypothetical protein
VGVPRGELLHLLGAQLKVEEINCNNSQEGG